ncbi:hypothetical protein [Brumimicrobium oceani]|uniref:Uncharacterized protein n=1 Tax=Brumimicrobium oceani TaxID=2100725 RepID=A0A2U2XEE1_9FLAO|nr:hypothetical protein [Brumimicrobium oceani]PWH86172.1 hypothetical protein DIT68_06350 [Brumimicrobium oceani]
MNYSSETHVQDYTSLSTTKRPKLLSLLLLLSSIYILSTLTAVTQRLIDGPMTQVQLEQQMSALYGETQILVNQGASPEYMQSTQKIVENSRYINNEVFYLSNYSLLGTLIVGLISVFLMFFGFKIGLCVYLVYSILPIITMYLITPAGLILETPILIIAFSSAVLLFLYTIGFNKLDEAKKAANA